MIEVFADIETVEAQDERVRAHVIAKVPPMDDLDAMLKAEAEALDKTAFNATFGEIVSISVAADDGEPKTWTRALGEPETSVLAPFAQAMWALDRRKERFRIVGWNVVDFDKPFIRQRCIVHRVKLPSIFHLDLKPWETLGLNDHDRWVDVMRMWRGTHRGGTSLDDACVALGLPGKEEVNGGDVGRLMREGRHAEVGIYNASDVRKTRAAYRRIRESL